MASDPARCWTRALIAGLLAIATGCEPRAGSNYDPSLVAALRRPGPGRVHGALRFRAPLTPDQHRALRDSGVVLLEYRGNDAYFAAIPHGAELGEGALANVSDADLLTPKDKIDLRLLKAPAVPPPWWVARGPDRVAVVVEVYADVDPERARELLAAFSPDPTRLGASSWSIEVPLAELAKIGRRNEVKRIRAGRIPPLPLVEVQRDDTRTDLAQVPNLGPARPTYQLDGSPIRVAICDDGISTMHYDFAEVDPNGAPAALLRVAPTQTYGNDHGTHVASIVAGSGYASAADLLSPWERRGHSPYARLGDFPRYGSNVADTHAALVDNTMRLSNHSYVQSTDEPIAYDGVAAELDAIVRGDVTYEGVAIPARPQVWSAGNNGEKPQYDYISMAAGYYSVYASAKNTIAVGSINAPYGDLSPFSSLGPTLDGRIKPDLVAPGWRSATGIMAAAAGYAGAYSGVSGTSFAAPAVTGVLVLVMNQLQNDGVDLDTVLPSTYKALLVQGARDLPDPTAPTPAQAPQAIVNADTKQQPSLHAGPDFATGWGRLDAEATVELADHPEQWTQGGLELQGGSNEHCIDVTSSSAELKVTLAWDDPPGDAGTPHKSSKLVNDLDLTLVGPGTVGKTVLPWTLDPPPIVEQPDGTIVESFTPADIKPAYRGADHRNNVEMVVEKAPASGTWRAVVTAHKLPKPTQRYSLVTSHALEACQ